MDIFSHPLRRSFDSFGIIKKAVFFFLILTSCQASQDGSITPTVEFFDLYYPPSLDYIRENISSCITSTGRIAPYLYERFTDQTRIRSGDVVLTLGETEWGEKNYFATQIGTVDIVFIVNREGPVNTIDLGELIDIFSGKQTAWNHGSSAKRQITVWRYPDGSDLTDWLSGTFLNGSQLTSESKLAPHPGALMESISTDSGAIGFLPEPWISAGDSQTTNNIKILSISNQEIQLSLPVLAYMTDKPIGGIREFIDCLQEK